MYRHGWYQIAFEHELAEGLTPIHLAERRLMALKRNGSIRVFDATCPHRGANLAYGGKVCDDHVVCPFHGERVHLGTAAAGFFARDYASLVIGGGVFVGMSDSMKPDFPAGLQDLQRRFELIPGFAIEIEAPVEVVADNAFDSGHFKAVHAILNEPEFTFGGGGFGELRAEGEFIIPTANPTQPARVKYSTGAFSPGIMISEMTGDPPYNYIVMSTATAGEQPNRCTIRVTLGLKPPIDHNFRDLFMEASRQGLEQDRAVWRHVARDHAPAWRPRDAAAVAFREFCKRFVA
jgi:hypothetical protein